MAFSEIFGDFFFRESSLISGVKGNFFWIRSQLKHKLRKIFGKKGIFVIKRAVHMTDRLTLV